ncbi:MAG: hypothetical protein LBG49_00395 [Mycoplasmataceae bacterium]|nr:hypothetical protein [Mycoplasmataceae bacterium]
MANTKKIWTGKTEDLSKLVDDVYVPQTQVVHDVDLYDKELKINRATSIEELQKMIDFELTEKKLIKLAKERIKQIKKQK